MQDIEKNLFPTSIPESQEKKIYLEQHNIPHIYLGQGLIFTPPKSADIPFRNFLESQNIDSEQFPLSLLQKGNNREHGVYCSAQMQTLWQKYQEDRTQDTRTKNEAFSSFTHSISRKTIADLFSLSIDTVETFQSDSLMMALETIFLAIEKSHGKITSIILPEKHRYSGYSDFLSKINALGSSCTPIFIPEIQNDGNQDIEKIEKVFMEIEKKKGLALFIDQEHNNNSSGYDRNEELNEEFISLFSRYSKNIIYFGDIAYKGLKEKLFEPYNIVQTIEEKNIHAYFYVSFSKLTNYRASPNFKNILFATKDSDISRENITDIFKKIGRSMGIGTCSAHAEFIYRLIHDTVFQQEVETLRLYLQYIRSSLEKDLENTALEKDFSEKTSGIFRCIPLDIAQEMNTGDSQVVTVGERINIWPLGCPKARKIFREKVL